MVTVREQLSAPGPHFSLEFMPPRDDADEAALWLAIRQLEPLGPAFVSVTYGAGGSRRDRTVRITGRIARETTLLPVAHLTAVGHSVAELRQVIGAYAGAGVSNILALRGDPPGDPLAQWVRHPEGLDHAEDLVRLARSLGEFCVGVAAFPEHHPRSPDLASDTRYYVQKVRAGADFAITQMLFSAQDYIELRDRTVRAGAEVPLLPGIMPITSYPRLVRICELSGQSMPTELARRLQQVQGDAGAARALGIEHAVGMAGDLLAAGAPGLHFYTFNRSRATLDVLAELGWAPRRTRVPVAASLPASAESG